MHLIIADHTLRNFQGHSFEYCRSVRETALQNGWKVTTLGIQDMSPETREALDAEPFFTHGFFHHFPLPRILHGLSEQIQKQLWSRWNFHHHNRSLEKDLCRLLPRCNQVEKTLILFPTFGFNDLLGIIKFAERLDTRSNTQIALVKHFTSRPNLQKDLLPHPLYKKCFDRLQSSRAGSRIHLFADSSDLVEEYLFYLNKPMEVVPIPHTCGFLERDNELEGRPLVVGYMGDARMNKGFHFLPEAITLARASLGEHSFQCEIQANIRNYPEWQIRQAVRFLQQIPDTILHHEALDSSQYEALMKRIDIFVLPYTTEHYHSQTSGVFSEARALGKVTVVSRGTWMAREIQQQGGGILSLPEDPRSIGEAIIQAIREYTELKARARECACSWNKYHNCQSFMNELVSRIPGMSN